MRTVRSLLSLAVVLLFVGGFAGQAYGADPGDGHPYGPRGAPKNPAPKNPGGAPPQGTPPKKGSNGKITYSNVPLTPAERVAALAADPNGQGYTEQKGNTLIHHSLSKAQEDAIAALHKNHAAAPPKNLSGGIDAAKNAIAKAEKEIARAKADEQKNHTASTAAAVADAKSKKPTPLQALAAAVTTAEASRGGPSAAAVASQEAADARSRAAGAQALANANAQKKQAVDRAAKTSIVGAISGPGGSPLATSEAQKAASNKEQTADHVAAADHSVIGHGTPQADHADGAAQGPGR